MKRFIPLPGKGSILALSLSIAAGGVFTPVLPGGDTFSAPAVYAAESQLKTVSKEEALANIKKWVDIPAEYKLEHSQLEKPNGYSEFAGPTWNLHFRKDPEGGMSFTIDAMNGKLLRFSQYRETPIQGNDNKFIDTKQAEQAAQNFLHKVVDKQEAKTLSKANEYGANSIDLSPSLTRSFSYTRVVNHIPFLENGVHISIDAEGKVTQFMRRWYDGKLPSSTAAVSLEAAKKKLADAVKPSLSFVRLSEYAGDYGPGNRPFSLVYKYGANDGLMIEAGKGEVMNRFGQPVQAAESIRPLGSTIKKDSSEKQITKEEAQKIADDMIKRFPGSYISEGGGGYGASTGSDGIVHRDWHFRYVLADDKVKEQGEIQIDISDTGDINSFSNAANRRFDRGRKIENPISWDQAQKYAVEIVKTLFADRLGELYLLTEKPSDEILKQQLESGMGGYSIGFGWLKDGIPVENAAMRVEVDAETGKILHMWTGIGSYELTQLEASKPTLGVNAAKQKEAEKKQVMLTYFQSYPDWRYFNMGGNGKSEPLLVYRYVGDEGVVDAVSGKWISFREMREYQQPQDIADHPKQSALQFAIEQGFLKAKDGKVEPDKAVTRGELVSMVIRLPIGERMYSRYQDDQSMKAYQFEDVDMNSPYFPAIQQAIRIGIIPREGKTFQPDSPVSRIELAEMIARLAGYGKLLGEPEIFKTSYSDVENKDIPAVALFDTLEIGESRGKQFQPNSKVTRAEVAAVFQKLVQTFSQF